VKRDSGELRGDVMELVAYLTFRLDALRPMDDRAVACSAPVRGHLLGPLIGRVQGVGPADRVAVESHRTAEIIDA